MSRGRQLLERIAELRESGMRCLDIARELGCSAGYVSRVTSQRRELYAPTAAELAERTRQRSVRAQLRRL